MCALLFYEGPVLLSCTASVSSKLQLFCPRTNGSNEASSSLSRLCSKCSLQSVLLSQHRDRPTVLLLPKPLPNCCVPCQEHLPPTEPLCTGQSLLYVYIFNNTLPLFIQSQCLSCNVWLFVHQALIPSQQQGPYYTQALYAPPPHVIHHTTVVQPNGMPAAMYAPPIPPPRNNGVAMGMVAGTTMAMSAGELQQFIESYPGYKCVRFVVLPVAFTPQELC